MNKQYMKGVQKRKKADFRLDSKMINIMLVLFQWQDEREISIVKRKEGENSFFRDCQMTVHELHNGHTNDPKETFVALQ